MKRLTHEQMAAERERLRRIIARKLLAHESVADEYARLKSLTNQQIRAELRARKRKAAA